MNNMSLEEEKNYLNDVSVILNENMKIHMILKSRMI